MSNIFAIKFSLEFPQFQNFILCCCLVYVQVKGSAIGKQHPCNVGTCMPHINECAFHELVISKLEDVGQVVIVNLSVVLHKEIQVVIGIAVY